MSVDVTKVANSFQTFQDIWAAVLTIAIACTMLYVKASYAMFSPLILIIVLLGITSTSESGYRRAPPPPLFPLPPLISLLI